MGIFSPTQDILNQCTGRWVVQIRTNPIYRYLKYPSGVTRNLLQEELATIPVSDITIESLPDICNKYIYTHRTEPFQASSPGPAVFEYLWKPSPYNKPIGFRISLA